MDGSSQNRIYYHFKAGHLPKECYQSVTSIEYATLETEGDMVIYELYYISKMKPKYNTATVYDMTLDLKELEFVSFKNETLMRYKNIMAA